MDRLRLVPWMATCAVALLSLPAGAGGQTGIDCSDEHHTAFDFWVGDWDVRRPDSVMAGRNTIRKMAGGCGLAESWRGVGGGVGESLSYYDPGDGRWHQLWLDASGQALRLVGGPLREGVMRMEQRSEDGRRIERITWTLLADGRVRQQWVRSADGGGTWATVFDGYYARAAPGERR